MNNKKTNTSLIIVMSITIISLISMFLLGIIMIINITNLKNNNSINGNIVTEEDNIDDIEEEINEEEEENIDNNIEVTYDGETSFLLEIEDVFTLTGRGTIVTGKVEKGTIKVNDEVQIIGLNNKKITTTVMGVEMFRQNIDSATVGDNCGILLKDVSRDEVSRGELVIIPASGSTESVISSITKFEAEISVLTKEEGGRHTPFFNGYSPMFNFSGTDIKGSIDLQDGKEMVMPGEKLSVNITLEESISINIGNEFEIREGGRIIATGIVKKVN